MAYFPLFVNLDGKRIVVVGGGKIAARRIKALKGFGGEIEVISPKLNEELQRIAESGEILWKKSEYQPGLLSEPFFVLAAAVETVNQEVAKDCRRMGIPINDASKKENCDFYFPGLIKEGDAVIGVTSGGADHKLAAALSSVVRKFIQETWKA